MRRLLTVLAAALMMLGCSSALQDPCSEATIAAQLAAVTAECKFRKESECKKYSVIEECPLAHECDSRIDRVGANCHD